MSILDPFSRGLLTLASDPVNFASFAKFTFPRAPRVSLLPDTPGTALVQLSDRSYRSDDVGSDLRNLDLAIGGGEFLEPADLEKWRLFRATKQFFSFFPNYDASTLALNHFEGNLVREIGPSGSDPTVLGTSSYSCGALGGALYLGTGSRLGYNVTPPSTGSLNFWLRFPSDGSWYSLNGVYLGGVNVFLGWNHYSGPPGKLRFRPANNNDIDATPGQLPTFAPGEWFNVGLSWKSGTGRHARMVINGSTSTYHFERDLDQDPTFNNSLVLGYAPIGGTEYYQGPLDEVRLTSAYWDATEHGACYDRFAEVTAKTLASQTQGCYFHVVSDDIGFISKPQTDRLVGRLRFQSAYVDSRFLVSQASASYPS